MTASAEELRLELAPGWAELRAEPVWAELSAQGADVADAKIVLGLNPRAVPDGEPHCDWCGRSDVPLADESLGGPQVHACKDAVDCAETRLQREPAWIDNQHPGWRINYQKVLAAEAYYRELQARRQQSGGGIYALAAPGGQREPDAEFTAALSMLREMVDQRVPGYLALSAPAPEEEIPEPAPAPGVCAQPGCDHITLRCPRNRGHLHGHFRQHYPGVVDAASSLARKKLASAS